MAEFKELINKFNRMCAQYDSCCSNCPLDEKRTHFTCWRWIIENPDESEDIILKWDKENPAKTNAMKFKEVFEIDPFATWDINGRVKNWFLKEYKEPESDD